MFFCFVCQQLCCKEREEIKNEISNAKKLAIMRPKVKFMFNFRAAITISFISFARLKFQLDYYCCFAFTLTDTHTHTATYLYANFAQRNAVFLLLLFSSEFLLLVNFSTLLFSNTQALSPKERGLTDLCYSCCCFCFPTASVLVLEIDGHDKSRRDFVTTEKLRNEKNEA